MTLTPESLPLSPHTYRRIDVAAGELIQKMWEHPSIQDPSNGLFKRRNEFQLNDSAEYYFQDVMRLCTADYIPSEQDVLRSRVRTTGIVQSDFTIKNLNFKMCAAGHSCHTHCRTPGPTSARAYPHRIRTLRTAPFVPQLTAPAKAFTDPLRACCQQVRCGWSAERASQVDPLL